MKIQHIFTLVILIIFMGCTKNPKIIQFELAEKHIVNTKNKESQALYEQRIVTKDFKTLRLFVHINNQAYKESPFSTDSKFIVYAYYGIGNGSWGYFSKEFSYKSTSGWGGVVEIPVIGNQTRISVYGREMKNKKIEVDIAATLF